MDRMYKKREESMTAQAQRSPLHEIMMLALAQTAPTQMRN